MTAELEGFACVSAETAVAPDSRPPGVTARSSKREQKPCKFCGKLFGRSVTKRGAVQSPSGFKRQMFCCGSCRGNSQRKPKEGT